MLIKIWNVFISAGLLMQTILLFIEQSGLPPRAVGILISCKKPNLQIPPGRSRVNGGSTRHGSKVVFKSEQNRCQPFIIPVFLPPGLISSYLTAWGPNVAQTWIKRDLRCRSVTYREAFRFNDLFIWGNSSFFISNEI